MSTLDKQQRIPKPDTPLVNEDGRMSKIWYDWFKQQADKLDQLIDSNNDLEDRVTTLEP